MLTVLLCCCCVCIAISDPSSPDFISFQTALTDFAKDLAKLLVLDGEGVTKFVTIQVDGARTYDEAKTIATSVATSALVKTAFYGQDANWGRIICAVGYAGVPLDTTKVNMWFVDGEDAEMKVKQTNRTATIDLANYLSLPSSLHIFKDGAPFHTDEATASALLKKKNIYIRIDLGLGSQSASVFTCDFSSKQPQAHQQLHVASHLISILSSLCEPLICYIVLSLRRAELLLRVAS